MIAQSLQAIRLALGSWPLTFAAVALYVLFGLAMLNEPLISEGVIAGLMVPFLIGLIIINYMMSRRAGAPTPNENGSVGGWLGWGLLAALPFVAILLCYTAIVGFDAWSNSEHPFWIESILYVVATIFAMPFYALSMGRAINREGASASRIFSYCKQCFAPIILSGFALLLIPNLLSDALLYGFGMEAPSSALSAFLGVAGGLALMAAGMATIGLSAAIYRNAEKSAG